VRQSRREARGSNRPPPLPNRPRLCGPPAALHFPTPGARNRFWRLVSSPRHRLRADICGNIISFWIDQIPPLGYGIFIA
jgi:hypothetical protein